MNNMLDVGIFKKGRLILYILRSSMKKEKIDLAIESETNGLRKSQTRNLVYKVINYPFSG